MTQFFQSSISTKDKPLINVPTIPKVVSILGAAPQKENVVKEGWIFKKSKHVKSYRRRFMQLKGDKLLCYRTDRFKNTHESATEIFDLSIHRYRLDTHDTVKQKFYLINETTITSRTFKAESASQRNSWVFHIRNNIYCGKQLRQSSVQNTNKYYGSKIRIGPTFNTIESQMAKKTQQEMHDSDSEQSDESGTHLQISKRKTNLTINRKSFANFRIKSITIRSYDSDNDILDTENDNSERMYTVIEEKCDYKSKLLADRRQRSHGINNTEIINRLQNAGYKLERILEAMKCVTNPNNIHEIQQELDAFKQTKNDIDIEKRVKNRRFIEQEIVSTEETYVNGLYTLLNELIQPMFDYGYVNKKYYNKVRSTAPIIFEFHKLFLNKLNKVYIEKDCSLSSVFNEYITEKKEMFINMYLTYLNEYDMILDLFGKTFHGNNKLDEFLYEKRGEGKPLSGHLILPVQRVPRYILLLKDLLNNTEKSSNDYKDIRDAVEMINDITREINDRKRKIENLSQLLQIQEALKGLKEPIVNDNRMFLQQFIFIKKNIKHQRIFFVFNDIVIIGNEKWQVKDIMDIRTLEIKVMNNNNKISKFKRKLLPEFQVIYSNTGSVEYIAKDMNSINKLRKLIGKYRIEIMKHDIILTSKTLGSLKSAL
eukprot:418495_1